MKSDCSGFKNLARQELLIVFELGFVPLSKTGAEMLFEVLSQRYERASTLVTSNLPFAEWTEVLGSERLTGALLDWLDPPCSHFLQKCSLFKKRCSTQHFLGPRRLMCYSTGCLP